MQRCVLLLTTLLCAAALPSCALGGQTGSEAAPDREVGGNSGGAAVDEQNDGQAGSVDVPEESLGTTCKPTMTPLERVETSPLEFSAKDIEEFAVGTWEVPMLWNADVGLVAFGPESGEGMITIELESQGTVRFVTFEQPELCGGDRLELDVTLSLLTQGGALDEHVDAVVVAEQVDRARLSVQLELSELGGSFLVDLPAGQTTDGLNVEMEIDASSVSGSLWSTLERREQGEGVVTVSATNFTYARWPIPDDS